MLLITGGGTGGHLAIAKALSTKITKYIYVGSVNGQDKNYFNGDNCYFLKSSGFVNSKISTKIKSLLALIQAIFICIKIFKKHKISCVFSVGGYSSLPASIAAIIMFKPLIIHEQNSKMGLANRICKPFSKRFFCAFCKEYLAYPINNIYKDLKRQRKEIKCILILGGSQGASFLNEFAYLIYPYLLEKNIHLIHQCGEKELKKYEKLYENFNIKPTLIGFSKELINYIRQADFCISRAGASSCFELCANALPTLFVPYKYAYKNHQYFNAKFFVDKKLAYLCNQDDLNKDFFTNFLDNYDYLIANNLFLNNDEDGLSKLSIEIKKYIKETH